MLTIEEKENQAKLINRLSRIADSLEHISDSLDKLYLMILHNSLADYAVDMEADFELSRED